jgi:hypothetical protein|tara:strand:- start:2117 stop:2302 length:186 start_codon:yes stop_codon:yes gene_type:complete
MAKSSKFKQNIKDYGVAVLTGGAVLLGLLTIATSMHYFLTLIAISVSLGAVIYLIWRLLDV